MSACRIRFGSGASSRARTLSLLGSSAVARGRTLGALALSAAALLLGAGAARAEAPKLISYGNFASDTPFPFGVAVDQASSDLYATGVIEPSTFGQGHVAKLDGTGKLLPPSPFGQGYDSGVAVNPTNGDVYVLAGFSEAVEVHTYDPSSGAPISSFPVPASKNVFGGFFTVVQIATDSAGNVYVPNVPGNKVEEYSPNGTLLQTFTGSGTSALSEPVGVALDSSGDVWVADAHNNRIEELSATGTFIEEIKSEGVQAVALDAHGDVFALVENGADFCGSFEPPCSHVVEYSSAGAQIADIGAGSIGAAGSKAPGTLAVNAASGRVYVTDLAKNLIWVYGPPAAPVIGQELAAEVGTSEAKLGALVNPGGIETSYRFEYGTTSAYGHTTPFPEGNVGQGVTPRTVWAAASGLAAGVTYHYRVVASNELGTSVGADQTLTTETAAQAGCPNEQLRTSFSASLPDCRAFELVSPPTKSSTQPDPFKELQGNHAALDGGAMSYWALDILPGSQTGGSSYLSVRGASGWTSEDVIPLQSYTALFCTVASETLASYSADLSKGLLSLGARGRASAAGEGGEESQGGCDAEGVEVVQGEPLGYQNLLLRDNRSGAYELINRPPAGVTPADAHFQGASPDLSHIVFDEHAPLTPGAPAGVDNLYEWSGGVLRPLAVLPDGSTVAGSLSGPDFLRERTVFAASSNSSPPVPAHTFFTAQNDLYVRVNPEQEQSALAGGKCTELQKACTVQVDASQTGGSSGGGRLVGYSADGSQAFFTDERQLTAGSSAAPGEPDLYEFVLGTGQLTDLTALTSGHADVQGVSGVSDDGSYVYFLADGALTGSQTNERGQTAQASHPNLYLWHGATITFIATLFPGDSVVRGDARVSPDGRYLAFVSSESLTGYDNLGAQGFAFPEIFLYDAITNQLACASCNPSGEAPAGAEASGATMRAGFGEFPRYLSNSGQVFFETQDALLPSDTNGQVDVYEYEAGQLHLISTGTSSSESAFLDASENGSDAFFLTRQKLVPQDTEEEARNIYDAHVNGGFATIASPPPCTTADACRSAPEAQPSIYGAPPSATFSGVGNLTSSEARVSVERKRPGNAACKRLRDRRKRARCEASRRRRRKAKSSHRRPKAKSSHKGGK